MEPARLGAKKKRGKAQKESCKKDDNTNWRHLPCKQPLGQQFFRGRTNRTTLTVCRTSPCSDTRTVEWADGKALHTENSL